MWDVTFQNCVALIEKKSLQFVYVLKFPAARVKIILLFIGLNLFNLKRDWLSWQDELTYPPHPPDVISQRYERAIN